MNESYPVIANRISNSIKSEIALLPKRMADYIDNFNFGFTFHNLACPCELLLKYWGDKLIELGYQKQIDRISYIAQQARYFQNRVESIGGNPANIINDEEMSDKDDLILFALELESLVPVLFFM